MSHIHHGMAGETDGHTEKDAGHTETVGLAETVDEGTIG